MGLTKGLRNENVDVSDVLGPVSRNYRQLSGPENYLLGAQYSPIAVQFLLTLKAKF